MNYTVHTSPSKDELAVYSDLKRQRTAETFIAESEKVVNRLLASCLEIESMYLTQEHFAEKQQRIDSHQQPSPAKIFIADKDDMRDIVGYNLHQGLLASAKIPKERTLTDLISSKKDKPLLFVLLDEIADAENIGTVYRTSLALGAEAVIIDKQSVTPWLRRSVRVSMGAVFELPTITVSTIQEAVTECRSRGIYTVAATLGETAEPIWNCDWNRDAAIVFGSEGYGVSQKVIDACDGEVIVPMTGKAGSLNIAIAHGMLLYEILRQRLSTDDRK